MEKSNHTPEQENDFAKALEQLHEQIIATDPDSIAPLSSASSTDQRIQSAAEILRLLELKVVRDSTHANETMGDPSTKWSVDRDAGQNEEIPFAQSRSNNSLIPDAQKLGRFTIIEQIGRGGFGIVVRARDEELNRDVAIKIPRLETALSSEAKVRFEREAQAAAALNHPSIVSVYETGWQDGTGYIVCELVDGVNLADWLARGSKPSAHQCAELMSQLADAIEHSHQRGVLHRDLKPSNVLLPEAKGEIKALITDFGLASIVDEQDFTQTGAAVGTPAYMSPEQAAGNKKLIGPATDVYGLGTILYQVLCGRAPFADLSTFELLRAVMDRDPALPSSIASDVPRDLEAICMKCLAKEPPARYATAMELRADLQRFLDGIPVVARPVTKLDRASRWVRRNKVVSTLAVLLFFALSLGLLTMTILWQRSESNRKLAVKNQNLYQQKSVELTEAFNDLSESRNQALTNLDLYHDKSDQLTEAINRLFVGLANNPEVQQSSADGLRRTLLTEANLFQASFVSEAPDDAEAKLEYARLLKSLSRINLLLGDSIKAGELAEDAIGYYAQVEGDVEIQPGEFSDTLILKGRCLTKSGEFEKGNEAFDLALERLQDRIGEETNYSVVPKDELRLYASAMAKKAYSLLHQDQLAQSHDIVSTAMLAWDALDFDQLENHQSLLFTRMDRGFCRSVYGETLRLKREYPRAQQLFEDAIDDFEAAGALFCQRENAKFERAKALRGMGLIDALQKKFDDAVVDYENAIELFQELVNDHPLVENYAKLLSSTRYSMTASLMEMNQLEQAGEQIEINIEEKRDMIERFPDSSASTYSYLGDALNIRYIIASRKPQADPEQLKSMVEESMEAFEDSLELNPDWSRPKMALGRCRINYGMILMQCDLPEEAKVQLEKSREELDELIAAQNDWSEAIDAYYGATINLVVWHINHEQFEESIQLVTALTERWPDHPRATRIAFGKPRLIVQAERIDDALIAMRATFERWGKTENDCLHAAEQTANLAGMEQVQSEEKVTAFEDLAIEILHNGFELAADKQTYIEKLNMSNVLSELVERRDVSFE